MAEPGEVVGIDLSTAMLTNARARSAAAGLTNVSFVHGDAQVHDFGPESFDVIISNAGAMFFDDKVAAFSNLRRALRPGGRIVLMAWQLLEDNEWLTVLRETLAMGRDLPAPAVPLPELAERTAVDGVEATYVSTTTTRDLLDRISLYAEQHRFIPALSASVGARITEMPVRHHARRYGESKYGISRTVKVLADLFTLKMITTFRSRPLLGFGAAAVPLVLGSLLFAAAAAVAIADFPEFKATAVVFPGAAMLFAAAAFYLVMLGLVAEVALSTERESANEVPNAWEVR